MEKGQNNRCKGIDCMRFQEEVLAKILPILLSPCCWGIVAFEAWGLSRTRSRRKDAEDNAAVLQEEVETCGISTAP